MSVTKHLYLLLTVCILSQGCGGLGTAYRTLTVAKQAGDQTGKTLAAVCKSKRLACFAKHEAKPPELRECLRPCRDALKRWVSYARPTLNASLALTFAALEVAYKAKKNKADWIGLIKPGVCGLLKVVSEFSKIPELAKSLSTIVAPLRMVEGLVCNG